MSEYIDKMCLKIKENSNFSTSNWYYGWQKIFSKYLYIETDNVGDIQYISLGS